MLPTLKRQYFFLIIVFCLAMTCTQAKERLRVLYVTSCYPQISQTYEFEEIASLWENYEIKIVSLRQSDLQPKNYFPYTYVPRKECIKKISTVIHEFKPHVMHTHFLYNALELKELAELHNISFTVRGHSFDFLSATKRKLQLYSKAINSKYCLRFLCFPAFKQKLVDAEFDKNKLVACWPVINYQRFYNSTPRQLTGKVLNVGATLSKKNYQLFIDLAVHMKQSELEFNLYVLGYNTDIIKSYNAQQGDPVTHITYVEPEEMPKVYRDHDWLVYTSDTTMNTVGFPVSIAEAQASGIGVCWQELPGRREEQLEYLGGAGFLFKSIDELPDILSKPYPESMRLIGLENAKKCDIEQHKIFLTEVWDSLLKN